MSLTVLGIALGSLGSVAINTGNNVQSLGMAQLEVRVHAEELLLEADDGRRGNKATEKKPSRNSDGEIDSYQSKTWIVGTVIFILGSLLNFSAFAFAPQSILASLEGIQFVTNVLFGKLVLDKVITRCMWAGTAVTISGVVLTVLSASVVGTLEASFRDLQALWGEPAWLIYLGLTVTLGAVLQTTHQLYLKANVAGAPLPYAEYVLPATYATFSALFGTLSVVQAKILSELLTLQIEKGKPIFWGENAWFTYATLCAWLFLVGVWLFRMNEALSLYDPLFIIPLLQMNFILFAIVSGGIYFKEFNEFGTLNWLGFIAGVCLLFLGIYLLSPNALTRDGKFIAIHFVPAGVQKQEIFKHRMSAGKSLENASHDFKRSVSDGADFLFSKDDERESGVVLGEDVVNLLVEEKTRKGEDQKRGSSLDRSPDVNIEMQAQEEERAEEKRESSKVGNDDVSGLLAEYNLDAATLYDTVVDVCGGDTFAHVAAAGEKALCKVKGVPLLKGRQIYRAAVAKAKAAEEENRTIHKKIANMAEKRNDDYGGGALAMLMGGMSMDIDDDNDDDDERPASPHFEIENPDSGISLDLDDEGVDYRSLPVSLDKT